MKTLSTRMRKSLKALLTLVLALQIGIFSPIQAHASFFGDVLNAAAEAGGWPSDLPSPTALIALIDVAESCSKSSIMECVIAAEADPTIRSQLGDSIDKIDAGLAIYNDISTGNYLDLLEKLGKTAGCAAAAIVTGVPVCALAEALAAIGGAVADAAGAAAEAAGEWLQDLDYALFGGTPYMASGDYYNQFWLPFTADYVRRGTTGKVDDNTALTPRFVALAGGAAQSATDAGLAVRSVNQIHAMCMSYYSNNRDSDPGAQCNGQRNQFKARTDLLIALGKQMNAVGPAIDTAMKAQYKNWEDRLRAAGAASGFDIDKKAPKGPDGAQYKALIQARIGKVTPHTWCLDPICYESFDGYDGGTQVYSIAYNTFDAWSKTTFKAAPLDVMNTAIVAAAPDLQKLVDSYAKAAAASVSASASDARLYKVLAFHDGFKSSFLAINNTCKSLTHSFNSSAYSARCFASEPIQGCAKFVAGLSANQVDMSSDASVQKYIDGLAPGLKSCVDSSQKVAAEWQRMDNTYDPYLKGWMDLCNKDKNKDRCSPAQFTLQVAYDACVTKDIAYVSKSATNGISILPITFTPASGTAAAMPTLSYAVAGGFCGQEGSEAISAALKTDPNNVFGGGSQEPAQYVDLARRDPAQLALAAKIVAEAPGDCKYMATGKGPDEFHIVCTSAAAYLGCLSHFKDQIENREARTCHPDPNGYSSNLCCTRDVQTSAQVDGKLSAKSIGGAGGIAGSPGTMPSPAGALNYSGGATASSKTSASVASGLGAGAQPAPGNGRQLSAPSPGSALGAGLPGAGTSFGSTLSAPKAQGGAASAGAGLAGTSGALQPPVIAGAGRAALTPADSKLLAGGLCTPVIGKTDTYGCRTDAGMKTCEALAKDRKVAQCTRVN